MSDSPRDPQYSWVFQELTKDDGETHDLVSYIAYCLYKQRKVDFFESKSGNPTPQEVEAFNAVYLLPAQLDGLRNEAEKILTDVLNDIYSAKVQEVEVRLEGEFTANLTRKIESFITKVETNHSLLDTEVKSVKNSVDTAKTEMLSQLNVNITTLDSKVTTNHGVIDKEIKEFNKRDAAYWGREVFKGALITVVATLIVWGLSYALIGKALLGDFENRNIPSPSAPPGQAQ